MMDYLSCGFPDVSYHGKRAWFGDLENYSRSVGVLYAGEYLKDEASFYVAYNMHWMSHEFALPGLSGGRKWRIALDTGREESAVYPEGQEPLLEEQRMITLPERTIMVLIGK